MESPADHSSDAARARRARSIQARLRPLFRRSLRLMGWASPYQKLRTGETASFRPYDQSMTGRIESESGQLCSVIPTDPVMSEVAARLLDMPKTTVSAKIAALEKRLELKLIE